jgi:hypothetical protein
MVFLRVFRPIFAPLILLASCGGGEDTSASVFVYRSLEKVQCESGGRTLGELRAVLESNGVGIRSSFCAAVFDRPPAQCGMPAVIEGVFEISEARLGAAQYLGYSSGPPFASRASEGACP